MSEGWADLFIFLSEPDDELLPPPAATPIRRGELEKKNVRMLMPQPFSGRHDQFLMNYVTTGKAKILDTTIEVLGQHKKNYAFPINISVAKTFGTGQDSLFLGILKVRGLILPMEDSLKCGRNSALIKRCSVNFLTL